MIYEPDEDSFLLAKYVEKYAHSKVLDVGTGSGIQAETALKFTKDVLAVDIDKEAVNFVKKKGIKTKISNLFKNVKGKFDLIIFNPPYLPDEKLEDKKSKIITTGGKHGYEILERFFSQVNNYLNKNGKILIVFSSLTNRNKIDNIIKKNKLKFKLLEEKKVFFESLYCYLVERR
ncbi:MAG: HemK2/MTQ2 family protein methyltransferase [Nanoarchaeota archaeon]